MCNKSKLGDECNMGNISIYTERIWETSTYISKGHFPTKAQESYVAMKNNRERMKQCNTLPVSRHACWKGVLS